MQLFFHLLTVSAQTFTITQTQGCFGIFRISEVLCHLIKGQGFDSRCYTVIQINSKYLAIPIHKKGDKM